MLCMNSALTTYEILLSLTGSIATAERTTIRGAGIDAVAEYLRPGLPDVTLVKRGYTTWQVRSGGRIVGSVQEL